jgi:hypothetical protein
MSIADSVRKMGAGEDDDDAYLPLAEAGRKLGANYDVLIRRSQRKNKPCMPTKMLNGNGIVVVKLGDARKELRENPYRKPPRKTAKPPE